MTQPSNYSSHLITIKLGAFSHKYEMYCDNPEADYPDRMSLLRKWARSEYRSCRTYRYHPVRLSRVDAKVFVMGYLMRYEDIRVRTL